MSCADRKEPTEAERRHEQDIREVDNACHIIETFTHKHLTRMEWDLLRPILQRIRLINDGR